MRVGDENSDDWFAAVGEGVWGWGVVGVYPDHMDIYSHLSCCLKKCSWRVCSRVYNGGYVPLPGVDEGHERANAHGKPLDRDGVVDLHDVLLSSAVDAETADGLSHRHQGASILRVCENRGSMVTV